MTSMSYSLEPLTEMHREPVIDIFNHYIANSFAAYPEAEVGYAFFDLFLGMARGCRVVVAKAGPGDVVGFAFLHPYHPLSTFRRTAEITYFIHPAHIWRGIGSALLENLIEGARCLGVDCLLANISSRNGDSLAFHRKHGFEECGRFKGVGRKFGEDFDIVWMQRHL
jgi:L-amino acid N-acyltransferase YncA